MKNKFCKSIICALLSMVIIVGFAPALAKNNTADNVNAFIGGVLSFKQNESGADSVQKLVDNSFSKSITSGSEWYVIGLVKNSNKLNFASYETALIKYVTENKVVSAVTRQKYALALIAVGCKDEKSKNYVSTCVDNSIGQQGVMSWVFALHLMNNGCKSAKYSVSDVIKQILSLRNSDGGWSVSKGNSDVDVTAMTLQSLSKYYNSDKSVKEATNNALSLLSKMQNDSGDFSSYGTANAESTAQVIITLKSLGIDVYSDARFIKNGNTLLDGLLTYRQNDGSFCHKQGGSYNNMATAQAFCALVALNSNGAFFTMPKAFSGVTPTTKPSVLTEKNTTENKTEASSKLTSQSETEASSQNETSQPEKQENTVSTEPQKRSNYKLWASLTVIMIALIVSLVLVIMKKRNYKNFVFIFAVAAALICFFSFTNFTSAKNYYNGQTEAKSNAIGTVTLTIRCDTLSGKENAPENPEILPVTEFSIEQGETVYDVLKDASRRFSIPFEHDGNSYIKGIDNLYEFSYGSLSGWLYRVNGETKSVGCGECILKDGDKIEWLYTCESGNDIKG